MDNNFIDNLEFGRIYEKEAQDKIIKLNNVSIIEEQNSDNWMFTHFDFRTSDNITYEIKADKMSLKTNNFFIEVRNKNGLTGLSITKAEYHIITNTENYYLISTEQIRQIIIINRKHFKLASTKNGTVGYLVPKLYIIKHSKILL